jgi:hypothetical protein
MIPNHVCVFHNVWFDLAFLIKRGLEISKVKIRDTWLLSSIKNKCAYRSNKLKEIMRERFNIETRSEDAIQNYFLANGTEDYGDLPVELIGPYCCDDVRYTLIILMGLEQITKDEGAIHDLLLVNQLHFIAAERAGIRLHLGVIRDFVKRAKEANVTCREAIIERMGGVEVDVDDPQAMLKALHARNLHSSPREYYGETQFVLDDEFLLATKNELAMNYRWYRRRQLFIENLSAKAGRLKYRVWQDDKGQTGLHPSFWPSVHAKGGIPQCKLPNFVDSVRLSDPIRSAFAPREGNKFVQIRFCDLPMLVYATYIRDEDLEKAVREKRALPYLSSRAEVDWKAASLWMLKQIEGHGWALFENRLKVCGVKYAAGKGHYQLCDKIERAITPGGDLNLNMIRSRLENKMRDVEMFDRIKRRVKPPADKLWRALPILVGSSVGGIIAKYMDVFCRLAQQTNARMVFAHENELLFETPDADASFETAAIKLIREHSMCDPEPVIDVAIQRGVWKQTHIDAHRQAIEEMK